eukprot:TRINITY_DN2182_c0_g1_i1.p1 TRINITY_DN2182_c0_g1~~TRINITY_DN2182_c0_g1_i1.p1  ORF type:complete len:752 (+),score=191.81 TRINITY_DN2182_c0_g1_i1:20-2275(+)
MSAGNTCVVCGKPYQFKCSKCKLFSYCSTACGKVHWATGHNRQCGILTNEQKAEFLEKKEDANAAGALTLKPPPVYLFPKIRVEQLISFEEKSIIGCGLYNVGNSCYLNSVIQCLTHTAPFARFFASEKHKDKCDVPKSKFCLMCAMSDHVSKALSEKYEYFAPYDFITNLSSIGDFICGHQEDAHEFIISILNKIHNKMFDDAMKTQKINIREKQNAFVENTTLIYQMFGGITQSQIQCMSCQNVSYQHEPFLDLNLDLGNKSFSLEESFYNFISIENLGNEFYKCDHCKKTSQAQKQITIYQCPNILIIHLKKFDMTRGGCKINRSIVFSELLDIKNFMSVGSPEQSTEYELYAILVHYGSSILVGHYTAFVKVDDRWVLFDDQKVTLLPNSSVVMKQSPYLFLYRRIKRKNALSPTSSTTSVAANSPSANTSAANTSTTPSQKGRGGKGGRRGGRGGSRNAAGNSNQSNQSKEDEATSNNDIDQSSENQQQQQQQSEVQSLQPEKPKEILPHLLYYANNTDDLSISHLTLKLSFQHKEPTTIKCIVRSDGHIYVDSGLDQYQPLDFGLAFAFNIKKSSATYYNGDSVLVLHLTLLTETKDGEDDPESAQLEVQVNEEKSENVVEIDPDQEIDLSLQDSASSSSSSSSSSTTSASALAKSDEKKVKSLNPVQGIQEKLNISKTDATYGSLYDEIEKAWKIHEETQSNLPSQLQQQQQQSQKESALKTGRNEKCPCGSGRKFKQCHGNKL